MAISEATESRSGAARIDPFPGVLQIQPWFADGEMNAFFYNNGRFLPPATLMPDGRFHAFEAHGITQYYVAGTHEEHGPYVVVCLDRVPLPFFVGVRYQPKPSHRYAIRCAECVRRWNEKWGVI